MPEDKAPRFEAVDKKASFPELEARVLALWQAEDVFAKTMTKPAPAGGFVFYEGPPTANGKPGLHHVSARTVKDLYNRYKCMRGYRVQRRGGWDTHGLPVEVEVEKQIGSTGKQDIETYGIARFNELCRESVFAYIKDWIRLTERIGFWVDLDNAYVTYRTEYIESCWWILKSLFDRGLLFEDYKVTMHCPRCNTSLADHEVSLGMAEDVDDPSVWPKFPADRAGLVEKGLLAAAESRPVYFLAWTTTPWTLAANTALAVLGEAEYGLIEAPPFKGAEGEAAELYIMATSLAERTFGEGEYRVLAHFKGAKLAGLRYTPVLKGQVPEEAEAADGWRLVADEVVSIEEGTGIVHIAPAYGDLEIGRAHGLPTIFSVDLSGRVFPEVDAPDSKAAEGPYTGQYFKEADKAITRDLKRRGLMFRAERYRHAYPFCWRDGEPLLFYAKSGWYIRTTAVKDKLLANNDAINWVPDHVRTGRFGRWLENNVNWALSRERYWGTPLPIWVPDDGSEPVCVGSIAELEALTGRSLEGLDLHRPFVDEISFEKDGKTYRRVPFTIDVWFDSGAMPYAQWHYPFEHQAEFEGSFPADFICEAVDQTRGWFYSLHAIATLLTDKGDAKVGRAPGPLADLAGEVSSFRNCVVLGHINDAKGQKMSKSKGNVVDPWSVLDKDGADALRWYLVTSSPPYSNKSFDPRQVGQTITDFFLTLWNTYEFFVLYANIDELDLSAAPPVAARPEIDRWLTARLHALIETVTRAMDAYDATAATRAIGEFVVRDLSNWYVRRNRRRFWKAGEDLDKLAAYRTLYDALVAVVHMCAPVAPFIPEHVYQNLVRRVDPAAPASIHLSGWPAFDPALVDRGLVAEMELVLRLVELGRGAREKAGVKLRQPLPEVLVRVGSEAERAALARLQGLLQEELNVKAVTLLPFDTDFVGYRLRPNLPLLGPRLGKRLPAFRKAMAGLDATQVVANVRDGRTTALALDGETLEFKPEAFLIDVESPEGYVAMEAGGAIVVLNTELGPELVMEGQARDVVRLVQVARKDAGLEVTDSIDLGLEAEPELRQAAHTFAEMIRGECLIETLSFERLAKPDHVEELDLDGRKVSLSIRKARV